MTRFPHWPMSPTAKPLPAHFFEQALGQNMQARRAHMVDTQRRTEQSLATLCSEGNLQQRGLARRSDDKDSCILQKKALFH